MADGYFPTLVSADRLPNLVTNPIFVTPSDGTTGMSLGGGVEAGAILVTIASDSTGLVSIDDNGGSITVDGTVAISGTVTVSATNLDIRDLVHTQDSVLIGDGTATTLNIVAIDAVAGASDTGIVSMVVRDDVLTTLTPADGDYVSLRVDSTGKLWTNTTLTNTEATPLYVYVVNTVQSGSEVHSYDTAAAVAGDATDNHDYAVTGTNFNLKEVIASSSGAMKIEIQTGPVASLVTVAVGFIPKHGGTLIIPFDVAKEVPVTGTGTVRVIRTNREGAAQDVYSTIIGNDI